MNKSLLIALVACLGCKSRSEKSEGPAYAATVNVYAIAGAAPSAVALVLEPGHKTASWSSSAPAKFDGLAAGTEYTVTTEPPVIGERATFKLDRGQASVDLKIAPIGSIAALDPSAERDIDPRTPEKRLFVDVHAQPWRCLWRQGKTVVSISGATDAASLAAQLPADWQALSLHQDASDPKRDLAILVVDSATAFATVDSAANTVKALQRELRANGASEKRSAFEVTIAAVDDPWLRPQKWLPPARKPAPSGRTKKPDVRHGAVSVSGRLKPETIIAYLDAHVIERAEACYLSGQVDNPNLQGTIAVLFVIGRDGAVSNVGAGGSMPDSAVVSCVAGAFYDLQFDQPEGGIVRVTYPISFSPG